ncbi:general stress protein [Haloechinothrix sp. LS1_15]|uniref:general stress protein n=1 Tax=Haloechinothrix sp. LS1_15 TaxID=2652248 RepID=UPI002944AE1A|nr:general stress protein [Haloechinothrix sp. LS1_15]MDV6011748.1 magnesium transporter [Haloechinothrix sp. LS1_15]
MITTATPGPSGLANLPTPPTGWPIGSYDTYAEAQRAVDYLAENDFPVHDVTIVGVEPLIVERVTARLSWPRVLGSGALSGAWFGLLIGLLLSLFTPEYPAMAPILLGTIAGVAFGAAFAATGYASLKGQRGFMSNTQFVAGRYDVLCEPRNAERGRDLLARLAMQ